MRLRRTGWNETPQVNLFYMQTAKAKTLGTCLVCGQVFSASERLGFENPRALRHHTCPTDKLLNALRQSAETRGCTREDLLVMRLVEIQRWIICALGEVSLEQFCNSGPQGYVTMRLSETGFDISVEFRPVLWLGAIYYEALITPGSLQQRKAWLLARVLECASQRGVSMSKDLAENEMMRQLRDGENHWDGRKKADLSLEILSGEAIAFKALSFVQKDKELPLQVFAESPLKLQQLAQRALHRAGLQDANHP